MFVPCTASFAAPDSEVFPPLPSEQELPEEVFPKDEKAKENDFLKGDFKRLPPPPKDPDNIIHYRGNRAYAENSPLEIIHTHCERKAEADSFFFNNRPLPFGTRFNFNKKGNSVRMLLPLNEATFKLKVQNISSFDGKMIEPVELLIEVDSE